MKLSTFFGGAFLFPPCKFAEFEVLIKDFEYLSGEKIINVMVYYLGPKWMFLAYFCCMGPRALGSQVSPKNIIFWSCNTKFKETPLSLFWNDLKSPKMDSTLKTALGDKIWGHSDLSLDQHNEMNDHEKSRAHRLPPFWLKAVLNV